MSIMNGEFILRHALSPDTLVPLAALVWFCGGLAALLASRRILRRAHERLAGIERLVLGVAADLEAQITEETARLEESARERQSALIVLSERLDRLELQAAGEHAYEHAIELARMGLGPEQLMRSVGVTRGEAELLAHLHRAEAA
jgi:hypothetical protein